MKRILNSLTLLLFVWLLFGNFQCGEPEARHLLANVQLSPEKKTYFVGDTITLSFLMKDKKLFDLQTNTSVQFQNVLIPFGFAISGDSFSGESASFEFIGDTSLYNNFTPSDNDLSFYFGCPKQLVDYAFTIKIVLNNAGIYNLHRTFINPNLLTCDITSSPDNFLNVDINYLFDVESNNNELSYRVGKRSYSSESTVELYSKGQFWFEVKDK